MSAVSVDRLSPSLSDVSDGSVADSVAGSRSLPADRWSTRRVAKELGVYPQDVLRLVANGTIPATKIGRRWAIDPAAVAAIVQQLVATRDAIGETRAWRLGELETLRVEVERLTGKVRRLDAQIERKRRPAKGRGIWIPPKLRFAVLVRDGYACRYCGQRPPAVVLHVDHVIPVIDGGDTIEDNLVTSCSMCNLGKGRRQAPHPGL
jgi:excisionase family DNA binding protein